jgi:hypothetical protein
MRRDRALIQCFAGGTLVLRQLLLVWHLRRICHAGQVALALLNLRRPALALLALDLLRARLRAGWIIRLVDHVAMAATRAATLIGFVRVDIRLAALPLPQIAGV